MGRKCWGMLDLKIMRPVVEEVNRFCLHANQTDKNGGFCGKEVYEVGKCKGVSIPLAYSWPHFLNSDEKFRKGFRVFSDNTLEHELFPSEEKHGSELAIEPTTGLIWEYTRRFQVNVGFSRLLKDVIPDFDYLHEDLIYLPAIWAEMKYELPPIMGG